jgi:hypothetical protein
VAPSTGWGIAPRERCDGKGGCGLIVRGLIPIPAGPMFVGMLLLVPAIGYAFLIPGIPLPAALVMVAAVVVILWFVWTCPSRRSNPAGRAPDMLRHDRSANARYCAQTATLAGSIGLAFTRSEPVALRADARRTIRHDASGRSRFHQAILRER